MLRQVNQKHNINIMFFDAVYPIRKEYNDYSQQEQETVGQYSTAHVQKLLNKCKRELETNLPFWFLCKSVKYWEY